MWIKNRMYIVIIILITLASCRERENSSLKRIELGKKENTVDNITDLIDINQVTPVLMPDSITFGIFNRGVSFDDKFVFNDGIYTGNFVVVDSMGAFISSFSKLGDNPDEYKEVTSFSVEDNHELIVHDYQKQRFTYYDLFGNYIRRENIGYNFRNFLFLNNYLYLFTAKHVNKVQERVYNCDLLIATGDSLVGSYLPFNPDDFQTTRIHNPRPFSIFSGKLFLSDMLSDTIYRIENATMNPEYYFDYHNKTLPDELKLKGHEQLAIKMTQDQADLMQYDFLAGLSATGNDHFIYCYVHKMKVVYGIYKISSGQNKEFQSESFTPTFSKIFEPFTTNDSGNFICVVPLHSLEFIVEESKRNKEILPLANKIIALKSQIKDPEHPILLKYKVKIF